MAKAIKVPKKEGPFGVSQTKLFKHILHHPGCTFTEIKEALFNDKSNDYLSNLIGENKDYISIQKFDNNEMPSKYKLKADVLGQMINLKHYVKSGEFQSV